MSSYTFTQPKRDPSFMSLYCALFNIITSVSGGNTMPFSITPTNVLSPIMDYITSITSSSTRILDPDHFIQFHQTQSHNFHQSNY